MAWIGLRKMHFRAPIGYYEIERKLKRNFEVDISLRYKTADPEDRLEETANYEDIYRIAAEVFFEERKLIETVAWEIRRRMGKEFGEAEALKIRIIKKAPLLKGEKGDSVFEEEWKLK